MSSSSRPTGTSTTSTQPPGKSQRLPAAYSLVQSSAVFGHVSRLETRSSNELRTTTSADVANDLLTHRRFSIIIAVPFGSDQHKHLQSSTFAARTFRFRGLTKSKGRLICIHPIFPNLSSQMRGLHSTIVSRLPPINPHVITAFCRSFDSGFNTPHSVDTANRKRRWLAFARASREGPDLQCAQKLVQGACRYERAIELQMQCFSPRLQQQSPSASKVCKVHIDRSCIAGRPSRILSVVTRCCQQPRAHIHVTFAQTRAPNTQVVGHALPSPRLNVSEDREYL